MCVNIDEPNATKIIITHLWRRFCVSDRLNMFFTIIIFYFYRHLNTFTFIAIFSSDVILNAMYLFIDYSSSICCVQGALWIELAGSDNDFGFEFGFFYKSIKLAATWRDTHEVADKRTRNYVKQAMINGGNMSSIIIRRWLRIIYYLKSKKECFGRVLYLMKVLKLRMFSKCPLAFQHQHKRALDSDTF